MEQWSTCRARAWSLSSYMVLPPEVSLTLFNRLLASCYLLAAQAMLEFPLPTSVSD